MTNSQTFLLLHRKLQNALSEFGLPEQAVSLLQVLKCICARINVRRLYDVHDRQLVHIGNDALGTAFRCESFRLTNIVELILKHATPIEQSLTQALHEKEEATAAPSSNGADASGPLTLKDVAAAIESAQTLKRAASSEVDSDVLPPRKRTSVIYSESFTDDSDDSFSLSIGSYDSDSFSLSSPIPSDLSDISGMDEYSLAGSDVEKRSNMGYTTASDIEVRVVEERVTCEDDATFFADSSDDTQTDSEVEDLWYCKCGEANRPLNRFCARCWELRFGWLAHGTDRSEREPPKMRKRRLRKQKSREAAAAKCSPTETPVVAAEEGDKKEEEKNDGDKELSVYGTCTMCMSRPATGVVTHGLTSHVFGCYKCCRSLQEKNMKCPICRRTIERVTRLFVHCEMP